MNDPIDALLVARVCALVLPLGLAFAALLPRPSLRRAVLATTAGFGLALIVAAGGAVASVSGAPAAGLGVRLDPVTSVAVLLVATLALVIARYSERHLDGEKRAPAYARALLLTLSAIVWLVVSEHLLAIATAWTATSFALHELLTFHRERRGARVAAHKKFVVSRIADVCVFGALAIVAVHVGRLDLEGVAAWASARSALPWPMHAAALLVVAAVCLRSAQLPFHGWLVQVMEAPTPVSALLHAGVVNVGGLLLIRLAPLFAIAPAARTVLVVVGTLTAVAAALVMATRSSVKVGLAWSTCAQMGFMLIECGLGAWHLALLHLVAHSLYKAHAFLAAGGAVERWRVQSLGAFEGSQRPLAGATIAAAGVIVGAVASGVVAGAAALGVIALDPLAMLLALLLAVAFAIPLAREMQRGVARAAAMLLRGAAVTVLYIVWHSLFERLAPEASELTVVGAATVALGLLALLGVQSAIEAQPDGRLARALYPVLLGGLHLDEFFTRAAFRWWPPRLPTVRTTEAQTTFAERMEA